MDSGQRSQALATPVSLSRSDLGWKAAVSAVSEARGRISQEVGKLLSKGASSEGGGPEREAGLTSQDRARLPLSREGRREKTKGMSPQVI